MDPDERELLAEDDPHGDDWAEILGGVLVALVGLGVALVRFVIVGLGSLGRQTR